MKSGILSTYLFVLLLFCACSKPSSRNHSLLTIEFGEGGGFTGMVTSYELDFKLNRLSKTGSGQWQKVEKREVEEIAQYIVEHDIKTVNFNKPYNHYTFINVNSVEGQHNLVWGDASNSPPIEVLELYDLLNNLSKKYL